MKRVVGSPGTWSGMALRLSQSVFAAASTFSMVSGFGYSNYSAYFYMLLALILQLMWSLNHACKDIFALRNKKDLHTRDNLLFIVMVDWGILAAGLPAVRAFGRPGVHPMVAASCIFFLRVLAIGFIFLGPPSILAAAVVW